MSTLIKTPGRYVSPFSTSFQDLFERFFSEGNSPALPDSFVPQADVVETPDAYLINLAVPGMQKEDFGSFRRSFRLPDDVQADHVQAQYADGLLEVRLPKDAQKTRKHTISVQ
jgi:HSP20 family protein